MAESTPSEPSHPAERDEGEPDPGPTRLQGFSDAYFAIIITLLAIELQAPELPADARDYQLASELRELWPNFVAFAVSFVNVLIMWVAHHELVRIVTRVGTPFLYLNGALLFGFALAPFSTALLAEHILGPAAEIAAVLYCGVFLWIAAFLNLLWRHVSQRDRQPPRLVRTVTAHDRRRISRTYLLTFALYATAFAVAFVYPLGGVVITGGLGLFFAVADRLSGFASEDVARDA